MSSTNSTAVISAQRNLVLDLSEIESLVDVCRDNKGVQEVAELAAVCDVLGMIANRLNDLVAVQQTVLDGMENRQGGDQ